MAELPNDPWGGMESPSGNEAGTRRRELPKELRIGRTILILCIAVLIVPQFILPFLSENRGRALGGASCGWLIVGYLFYAMYDGLKIARWLIVVLYLAASGAGIYFGLILDQPFLIAVGSINILPVLCLGFLPSITRFLHYQSNRVRWSRTSARGVRR